MVEVFVAPLETELEHEVELGQRGVTSDQESTPDERTDASQDDTQLIDVWMGLLLFHAQSVRQEARRECIERQRDNACGSRLRGDASPPGRDTRAIVPWEDTPMSRSREGCSAMGARARLS